MGNRAIAFEGSLVPGPWHFKAYLGAKAHCTSVSVHPRHRHDYETLEDITKNISFITSCRGEICGAKKKNHRRLRLQKTKERDMCSSIQHDAVEGYDAYQLPRGLWQ